MYKAAKISSVYLLMAALLCLGFSCLTTEAAKKKPPLHPINLNTATAAELQQVPGIGPSTADKILKMRKSYGPFKSVDDLRAIKGIGPKRLEKMRKYLTIGKPQSQKKTQGPAPSGGSPPSPPPVRTGP
jgi:comEA protein